MIVKLILVSSIIGLIVAFVRSKPGVRLQASKRVGVVLFAIVNIYAVVRPSDVSVVANLMGVGRGTDLVLYVLVIAFLIGMLNFYIRFKETDRRFTELARAIAIREAELVNRERFLRPERDGTLAASIARTDGSEVG